MYLIYGHRGWIGGQLTELLNARGIKWVGGMARCDDRGSVAAELETVLPERVVILIGRTHGRIGEREYPTIDYLEQPGKVVENMRDNYVAPLTVVEECGRLGIHCTYLGTGCIFTYDDWVGFHPPKNPRPSEDVGADFVQNKMQKQAFVLGGNLPTWFGIKTQQGILFHQSRINDFFIDVPDHLKPAGYKDIENGKYW